MFAKYRAKVAEKKYNEALAIWQNQLTSLETCIGTAKAFRGLDSNELMLKNGEKLFYSVTGAILVGQRRGAGHYQGRSSGVSVPIGHIGHSSIRYHVGASKGTYVPGPMVEAAIDRGTVFITNQRVVFEGSHKTQECRFDKLIGVHHDQEKGETTFSVSNRQTPTTVLYGKEVTLPFVFRFELALAYYKNTVAQLISQYEEELKTLESQKPVLRLQS